jgi:hypothetical protein
MDTAFRIIGYLSVPVVLVGLGVAIWSTLRERPLRGRTLLLVAGIGFAYLIVHDLLRGDEIVRPLGWVVAGVGGLLGASWAERSRLRSVPGSVLAKGAAWYLAVWGTALVVAQLSALGVLGEDQWPGIYAVYLTTGLVPGSNLALWFRLSQVRRKGRSAALCPNCGGAVGLDLCGSCGWQVLMGVPASPR